MAEVVDHLSLMAISPATTCALPQASQLVALGHYLDQRNEEHLQAIEFVEPWDS